MDLNLIKCDRTPSLPLIHTHRVTYLKQVEVSVELSTFSVLQSFELSCDEHENVLETKKKHTQ